MFRRVICSIVFIALIPPSRHFLSASHSGPRLDIYFLFVFLNIRSKDCIQFWGGFLDTSVFFLSGHCTDLILNVWNEEAVSWENARVVLAISPHITGMCKPYTQGRSWVPLMVLLV